MLKSGKFKIGRPLAAALSGLLLFMAVFSAVPMQAQAAVVLPTVADQAMQAFNEKFWNPTTNYYYDSTSGGFEDFWVEAELWELVMDAYDNTSDPTLKAQYRDQIDKLYNGFVENNSYHSDWTKNGFNDDIMWWALACTRAYTITQNDLYKTQAKTHFDFVYNGHWDEELGGGLWWLNTSHGEKNACINFPAAMTAVNLYNIYGDSTYLTKAQNIYTWGKSILTDGNGKVYDRFEKITASACPDSTHYNQGTFIGAALALHAVTGDNTYLQDAVKAADYTESKMCNSSGILRYENHGDLEGGKGILVRNLAKLVNALPGTDPKKAEYKNWLLNNAQAAWDHRNSENIMGADWGMIPDYSSKPLKTWAAASGVAALYAAGSGTAVPIVKSAFGRFQAEEYDSASGVGTQGCAEGTSELAGIQNNGYIKFSSIDFGSGAAGFIARTSSDGNGGNIEIRLNSLTGTLVGTCPVQKTSDWRTFVNSTCLLSGASGVHDVYLTFTGSGALFNLNWVEFTGTAPQSRDAYTLIQAGSADSVNNCSKNGNIIDNVKNNGYAVYENVYFDAPAGIFTARVASDTSGGTIEIRLGSNSGVLLGTCNVSSTGGWSNWNMVTSAVYADIPASAVADICLVFKGTNGGDYPCNLDWFSFRPAKSRDAWSRIEAEGFDYGNNVSTGGTSEGGEVQGIDGKKNPYLVYNYIDFGSVSPTRLLVNAASAMGAGGDIEMRADSIDGPILGTFHISYTGDWRAHKVFSFPFTAGITGKHAIYLLPKGNDYLFNLNWFQFSNADPKTIYDWYSQVQFEDCIRHNNLTVHSEAGILDGISENGAYSAYRGVSFSPRGTGKFTVRYSSWDGGDIEIRLDSTTGTLVGTVSIPGNKDWSIYKTASCYLNYNITGTHDLYLVYKKTSGGGLFNLDWFQFDIYSATPHVVQNARDTIQAESCDGKGGGVGIENSHGNIHLAGMQAGNHPYTYYDIDFGSTSPEYFQAAAASWYDGTNIEIRLDSSDGALIGTCKTGNTGDWGNYKTYTCTLNSAVTGRHTVYLLFTDPDAYNIPNNDKWLANVDWFKFTDTDGSGNHAPVMEDIGEKTVNEGATVTFSVYAVDADGDTLTYSATGLPAGAAFDAGTRRFSWTPGFNQAGTHTVTFAVYDGYAYDTKAVAITVKDVRQSTGGTPVFKDEAGKPGEIKVDTPVLNTVTGEAVATVSAAAIEQALSNVTADANGVRKVIITVPAVAGAAVYVQQLPATTLAAGNAKAVIQIATAVGTIAAPSNMLNASEVAGAQNVALSIAMADKTRLDTALKAAIGNRPVVEINLKVDGTTRPWSNPEAPVTVSIPYTPSVEELADPEHIVVWYIDGMGNAIAVPTGKYDAATGKVVFTTTRFSKYAVAYVNKTFSDISNYAWARKEIEVMASKGVINGTSADTYTPAAAIKRADFILLLVKALGLSTKVDDNFSDVSPTAYYAEAVATARKLGITEGVGDNKFNPDEQISRQDMMTLINRAMLAAKRDLASGTAADLEKFADKASVAFYAAQSVATLVKNGIVTGDAGNINPLGNATRAETAVLIYRIYNK